MGVGGYNLIPEACTEQGLPPETESRKGRRINLKDSPVDVLSCGCAVVSFYE